jgi:hypothetical protein
MTATSGMKKIAGKGANGTYQRPSIGMTSLGPIAPAGRLAGSYQVRPWRKASAR